MAKIDIDGLGDDELFEPPPVQVSYSSGWKNTLGDHFKPTNKKVINGVLIAISPLSKEETEVTCITLSKELDVLVDWYWWRGRSFIKTDTTDLATIAKARIRFTELISVFHDRNEAENTLVERRMLKVCKPKD